jgi:hypothetical protein
MVDWSDSIYQYVKQRILAINPQREFGGIVEARDWPLKEPKLEAFYLITTTLDPNRGQGPGTNSWSSPLYGERIQWAWSIIGTDIAPDALATNRGDRYRTHFSMIQEILHGNYPGYCEKKQYSIVNGVLASISYMPKEFIWFTKPQFSDRIERSTGILFGSAISTISGFSPTINS